MAVAELADELELTSLVRIEATCRFATMIDLRGVHVTMSGLGNVLRG